MFQHGFPNDLRNDVLKVSHLIPKITYSNINMGISVESVQYSHDNHLIEFPYRIYFIDIKDDILNQLSLQQKMILHCIYTRSCNGYVRQQHLRALLLMNYSRWAIPYIVKLCDEYVIEILEMTYAILKDKDNKQIKSFCYENIDSFSKSHDRMVSYWNKYYRHKSSHLNKYVGTKLFRECLGYTNSIKKKSSFL